MRLPFLIASTLILGAYGILGPLGIFGTAGPAHAADGEPRIADVQIKRDSPDQPGIYHIRVTIEHEGNGWDDYVEAWEVFGPDGQILGVRPFFEPAFEKPHTVSALSGVVIPTEVKTVTIRARTYPDGFEGEPVQAQIPH